MKKQTLCTVILLAHLAYAVALTCQRSLIMTTPKSFSQISMDRIISSLTSLRPLVAAAATVVAGKSLTMRPESAMAMTTEEELASAEITKIMTYTEELEEGVDESNTSDRMLNSVVG